MAGDAKPLSKAARTATIDVARTDKSIKALLADGGRVVAVNPNLHDQKHPDQTDTVVVGISDYRKNRSLVALVDPAAKKVVGVEQVEAQFQLSDEEIQEAEALAKKDRRVRDFLDKRAMNPLTRLYFPPQGPQHRYAIVFVRPTNSERRYAIVDLSTSKVVDVLDQLND
jgi:hypothetical protein